MRPPTLAWLARVPGCIVKPTGPFSSYFQYNYSVLRANVEMHHALSITFAVSDQYGRRPQGVSAWRFNFQIGPSTFVDEDLLRKAFNAPQLRKDLHRRQGISSQAWGEEALGTCLVRGTPRSMFSLPQSRGVVSRLMEQGLVTDGLLGFTPLVITCCRSLRHKTCQLNRQSC